MAKIGLVTIVSIVLNLFLSFWLINQYMSDVYFQGYVNGTIGQYYPFIVLTLGVGGGSGLGYLFLKRKHGDTGLISKIQKSKNFKPVGPVSSSTSTVPSKQALPTGAPPSPVSKHTVYAVPPLPKPSTPTSPRSGGSTWGAAGSSKSSLESILSQKQEAPRPSGSSVPSSRVEPSKPGFSNFNPPPTELQPPQPLRSIGEAASKPTPSWGVQQPSASQGRPESGPIFQKPGMDANLKQEQQFGGFPGPSQNMQTSPVTSKWATPDEKPEQAQWQQGGVKSIPPLPTKWTPPSGPSSAEDRSAPPQGIPRPGPPPLPGISRGPLPPPQGGPRPFVIQGPGRPGDQRPMGPPRPIAAPQPFRPDPNRPPPGMGGPRPPQPAPRPAAPLAGPMPQPWTPQNQPQERREPGFGTASAQSSAQGGIDTTQGKSGSEQRSPPESGGSGGGGEMDWDTALDTILKTLRKDRVGDTK